MLCTTLRPWACSIFDITSRRLLLSTKALHSLVGIISCLTFSCSLYYTPVAAVRTRTRHLYCNNPCESGNFRKITTFIPFISLRSSYPKQWPPGVCFHTNIIRRTWYSTSAQFVQNIYGRRSTDAKMDIPSVKSVFIESTCVQSVVKIYRSRKWEATPWTLT